MQNTNLGTFLTGIFNKNFNIKKGSFGERLTMGESELKKGSQCGQPTSSIFSEWTSTRVDASYILAFHLTRLRDDWSLCIDKWVIPREWLPSNKDKITNCSKGVSDNLCMKNRHDIQNFYDIQGWFQLTTGHMLRTRPCEHRVVCSNS